MQTLIACLILTGIHGLFVTAEFSIVKTFDADNAQSARRSGISDDLSLIHGRLEEYLLVCQIGKTATVLGIGVLLGASLSQTDLATLIAQADLNVWLRFQIVLGGCAIFLAQLVLGMEIPKRWSIMHADWRAELSFITLPGVTMKIAILSRNPRLYSTRRLVEVARAREHEVVVLDVLRCYMNVAANKPEVFKLRRIAETHQTDIKRWVCKQQRCFCHTGRPDSYHHSYPQRTAR